MLAPFVAAAALAVGPTPCELIEAENLIRCPEAAPATTCPRAYRAAHAAGVRLGLIGPGETAWGAEQVGGEYRQVVGYAYLGRLRVGLADCPPLSDADRLGAPPADWCDRAAAFNRALAEHWRAEAAWSPDRAGWYEAAAREAEAAAPLWHELGYVEWGPGAVARRREALRYVRGAIGREAYDAGELPPVGPFHRLRPR